MTALPASGTFAMVDPAHVAEVGPAAAILFARIVWRAGESGAWRATRGDLSAETGLSPEMIRTATRVLRDREWVTAERASTTDATLVWSPVLPGQAEKGESPISEVGESPMSRVGVSPSQEVGESPMSSYETRETSTPLPPEGEQDGLFGPAAAPSPALAAEAADPLRGFDAWYSLYPRKIAKGDARKAWGQVLRGGADPEVIRLGLLAQLETLRDQHERGFCPYPASWLRAERWEDAPDNVRQFRRAVPEPGETFDPAAAAALPPPPRKDLFG